MVQEERQILAKLVSARSSTAQIRYARRALFVGVVETLAAVFELQTAVRVLQVAYVIVKEIGRRRRQIALHFLLISPEAEHLQQTVRLATVQRTNLVLFVDRT